VIQNLFPLALALILPIFPLGFCIRLVIRRPAGEGVVIHQPIGELDFVLGCAAYWFATFVLPNVLSCLMLPLASPLGAITENLNGGILSEGIAMRRGGMLALSIGMSQLVALFLIYRLPAVKAFLAREKIENSRPAWQIIRSSISCCCTTLLVTVGFGCVWSAWMFLLWHLVGGGGIEAQEIVKMLGNTHQILAKIWLILGAVVIAPIGEELFFRGFMYGFFKNHTKQTIANIAVAFIFASLHGNIVAFGSLFVFSLCLVNLYERDGDIRELICVHAFCNAVHTIAILCAKVPHG
jgi:membrane protease YdiL (CAAX protease family)